MEPSELSRYRNILEKKRDELLASTPLRQPTTEPGSKSGDWIDQSSQESDLHVHLALKQTDTKVLRAIEEDIKPARLDAVPWTRVCINCKEKQSKA
jgi:RNA polymerase-binding transcription factor DksA